MRVLIEAFLLFSLFALSACNADEKRDDAIWEEEWMQLSLQELELGLREERISADQMIHTRSNEGDVIQRPILYFAITSKHVEYIRLLLEHGADANVMVKAGVTSSGVAILHLAVARNRKDIVKLLIDYGADVNAGAIGGETVLFTAADNIKKRNKDATDKDVMEMMDLLIKEGADVNITSVKGHNLLHTMVRICEINLTRYIVDLGVDVNAKDIGGRPPLTYAALFAPDLVPVLLKKGAVFDVQDDGITLFYELLVWGAKPVFVLEQLINAGVDVRGKLADERALKTASLRAGGERSHYETLEEELEGMSYNRCDASSSEPDFEEWVQEGRELLEFLQHYQRQRESFSISILDYFENSVPAQ